MSVAAPLQPASPKPQAAYFSLGSRRLQRKCASGGLTDETCEECRSDRLQTKLMIGSVNDPLEAEADRIANRLITATPEEAAVRSETSHNLVQRGVGSSEPVGHAPPDVVRGALGSSGQALNAATRAFFEPRLGHDFGRVRVHVDERAAASARAVGALAYTVGHDIVFDRGRYAPNSNEGRLLLAHELAHVVQQSGARTTLQRKPASDID
jgi:hypothetical protein